MRKQKKIMQYSTQLKLKFELSLANKSLTVTLSEYNFYFGDFFFENLVPLFVKTTGHQNIRTLVVLLDMIKSIYIYFL